MLDLVSLVVHVAAEYIGNSFNSPRFSSWGWDTLIVLPGKSSVVRVSEPLNVRLLPSEPQWNIRTRRSFFVYGPRANVVGIIHISQPPRRSFIRINTSLCGGMHYAPVCKMRIAADTHCAGIRCTLSNADPIPCPVNRVAMGDRNRSFDEGSRGGNVKRS